MCKISIITIVYNAEETLERTIQSVLYQSFKDYEYIIIDGVSTDNTLNIIKKYQASIHQFISEKDSGIYDAMNKALKKATGEYILYLNAGDELYQTNTLSDIFNLNIHADVYYGNTMVTDIQGREIAERRLTPPSSLTWKSFRSGMTVSHQSFIAKRTLCEPYNLSYTVAADIDWIIRILKKSKTVINTNIYISKFLLGGYSSNTRNKALRERFIIMKKHYGMFTTIIFHFYILVRYIVHKATKNSFT